MKRILVKLLLSTLIPAHIPLVLSAEKGHKKVSSTQAQGTQQHVASILPVQQATLAVLAQMT